MIAKVWHHSSVLTKISYITLLLAACFLETICVYSTTMTVSCKLYQYASVRNFNSTLRGNQKETAQETHGYLPHIRLYVLMFNTFNNILVLLDTATRSEYVQINYCYRIRMKCYRSIKWLLHVHKH